MGQSAVPNDTIMPLAPAQTTSPPTPQVNEEVVLTWTVHLLPRQRGRLGRLVLCLAATVAAGVLLFGNVGLALLPAVALTLSLSDFLFPIRYTLTERGAQARSLLSHLEMSWGDVRHAYLADDGVKLSPLRQRGSRWEALRGIFLRFDADNKDAVVAAVRRLREEARRDAQPS